MVLIKLLTLFVIIEKTVSDIHLKGGKILILFLSEHAFSNQFMIFLRMLDCDVSKLFENSSNFPDWGPCLNMKNGSNECGDGVTSPFREYEDIVTKEEWVSFVSLICFLHMNLSSFENHSTK